MAGSQAKQTITFMVTDSGGSPMGSWDSRISASSKPSYTFNINPTDLIRNQPMRSEVTPSICFDADTSPTGLVQTWGEGLPTWTIRGHTGYSQGAQGVDGFQAYVALYQMFEAYAKQNVLLLKDNKPPCQMIFINWADTFQDWWFVEPTKIPDKIRSCDRPLYYFYDINLVGVKPYANVMKVTDAISTTVNRPDIRLPKVAASIKAQKESLDAFGDKMYASSLEAGGLNSYIGSIINPNSITDFPTKIRNAYADIKDRVEQILYKNTIFTNIQKAVYIAQTTINVINNAINDIKTTVKTVLSPLYGLVNVYKQLKCALMTLITLPIDLVSSSINSIKQLIASLKASGCGTTITSDNTKIGFNSIK